jgi:hypothetical protein
LCGWRRRLCLNYVISERALWVAPADLFSANQIVHLRPITGAVTYRRFLEANRFVWRFYPNFEPQPVARTAATFGWFEPLVNYTVAPLLEPLCRLLYRSHLRRRAHTWTSREQVRLDAECLKLHTHSHRGDIIARFDQAMTLMPGAWDDDDTGDSADSSSADSADVTSADSADLVLLHEGAVDRGVV